MGRSALRQAALTIALVTICGVSARAADGPAAPAAPDAPAAPTETAAPAKKPRRVETPNGALVLALPEGWTSRTLKNGVALEPPGTPVDETIVAACEPFALASIADEAKLEDLLARLRSGQLATFEESPRPRRERLGTAAIAVTYKGTDDGGQPAALRVAVLPSGGRVAILTARIPYKRLEARARDLDAIVESFLTSPPEEEKALARRLAGTWRSEAAPLVAIRFLRNGTFEETREGAASGGGAGRPSHMKAGSFDVVGREVRLRFDDGQARAFRVDQEEPAAGTFVSAGQVWTRIAQEP